MNSVFESYLSEKQVWQKTFDRLLKFGSEGLLETEILKAKEVFFSKLGRSHEMKEDLYETASQSFLEWYLFNYPTQTYGKTPAVAFYTLERGSEEDRSIIERSLFFHWSIYEVTKMSRDQVYLKDLLFGKIRRVVYDSEDPEFRIWRVKPGQLIQTRLFHLSLENLHFFTHLWLHPSPEDQVLKKLCLRRQTKWSRHTDLLISSFEAVIRSHGLRSQIKASGSSNWMYQELWKNYA